METNSSTAAVKFDAGLASVAVLQCQHWHQQEQRGPGMGLGLGNGDVVKGFHGSSGWGRLITPLVHTV